MQMLLTCISKLFYKGFIQCQIVFSFLTSSVVCGVFSSFRIEMYILKFAYDYICLKLFMNYIFQRVWSELVIHIFSLQGFAQINDCLISVNGYFFLLFFKSKIRNEYVSFWISLTSGLTNYFFFPLNILWFVNPPMYSLEGVANVHLLKHCVFFSV